jgi:hypothetical protein
MDRRQLLFGASALGLVTNLNLNHPLIAQVGTAVMGSRCLSDRERAGLRGPVKTCSELIGRRIESINTDYSTDGRLLGQRVRVRDFPGPFPGVTTGLSGISGGTEETWEFYDEQGKKTKVLRVSCRPSYVTDEFHYDEQGKKTRVRKVCLSFNQPDFPDVMLDSIKFEVAEAGGSLVGSGGGTVTTRYNENDQPIESLVRNSGGELLTKINHNYTNGRLISETLVIVRVNFEMRQMEEQFSENEQARAFLGELQSLRTILLSHPLERSYTYDADDRVIRRLTQMGNFKEDERKTYKEDESKTYNEQGDEDWTLMIRSGIVRERSEFRYLYQYDSHGNWTERTRVNAHHTDNPNTQRRTLSYYGFS